MLELFRPATRKDCAVPQTQMRTIVENRDVGFAQQAGDGPECTAKTAVKKHRVFATQKFCEPTFQFAVEISHARKHRRTARAEAVGFERFVRGRNHFGMIGEAKIIVGTEIDYRLRLALVFDSGARFRGGEQGGLVQFNGPRAKVHPPCEAGRGLKRIAGFASEKITQTEFCRIDVHSLWQNLHHWAGSISGQLFYCTRGRRQELSAVRNRGLTCGGSEKYNPRTAS